MLTQSLQTPAPQAPKGGHCHLTLQGKKVRQGQAEPPTQAAEQEGLVNTVLFTLG